MEPLLTAAEMREADRYATQGLGIPEMVLMEHAALGLVDCLESRFLGLLPTTRGVVIAGTGNNGGDVLAAARILAQKGCSDLFVVLVGDETRMSRAAALQLKTLGRLGLAWSHELAPELLSACDWILDGIFGTGLSRPVEGPAAGIIAQVNAFAGRKWIVAADVPSGLDSDRGQPMGVAVVASETATFGFIKRGLVTGAAADHVGRLRLFPIQIPRTIPAVVSQTFLYTSADSMRLPSRRATGHKGNHGHVFVLAGTEDKQGASLLAARAAFRCGTGLVTIAGRESELPGLRARLGIEVMTTAWSERLAATSGGCWIVGPGMGTQKTDWKTLAAILEAPVPLVLDGDALTLLAGHAEEACRRLSGRGQPTIMTPHPKEAARLLSLTVDEVQADRYRACAALVERFHAGVILKGRGTLVSGPDQPTVVVCRGNTGLSKAGTGDVLAGTVGALVAQGTRLARALPLAAHLHGRAGEIVTERQGQERSLLAGEVADALAIALEEIEGCSKCSKESSAFPSYPPSSRIS